MFEVGRRVTYFVILPALLLIGGLTRGEDGPVPFVSGFDRFARHGQIEPETGGLLLLSEFSCTACHRSKIELLQPKLGPRLDGVGVRLQPTWLRRFLSAPQAAKAGTTMPDVLAGIKGEEKERAIDALVAFLSAQHEPFPEFRASGANPLPHQFWKKGNAAPGQQLFHQVGCVACHEPDEQYQGRESHASRIDQLLEQLEPEEITEMGLASLVRPVRSVPHGDLAAKYSLQSLTFFLVNPELVRPSGRMPSLKLTPVEAADLAAYLLRESGAVAAVDRTITDAQLVEEGRRLFSELRCANCHSANSTKSTRYAKPLAELDMAATNACYKTARRELPHFNLDQAQIQAVRAALLDMQTSGDAPQLPAQDQADFRMMQLNCHACHQRGVTGGVGRNRRKYFETVGHIDLGDEGRLPPPLSGVGRKLQPAWLKKVFDGTGDLRPYMRARMPRYPKNAVAPLPGMFAQADAAAQPSEKDVFGERGGLAEAGRALVNTGCVQCHPTRGESLPGVAGVDLAGIGSRVQAGWFRDFLRNPEQLKRGTRMPTFFPNGKSSNQEVLGGDVDRQVAAIWTYLKEIDKHPLPPKLVDARSQDFELVPKDRPILLRTFMEQAGTHAIAVGFPQKVHFAFDAENVRLAQVWRGRFLDAYGTWFVRFAPPAEPLGNDLTMMPAGVPLALLKDKQQFWPTAPAEELGYRFLGYRFDRSGVPTFLYRLKNYDIEDRIEPNTSAGLSRRLRIVELDAVNKIAEALWFRVNAGKSLRQKKPNSYTNELGLTTTVSVNAVRPGIIRLMDGQSEWLIPVAVEGEATIQVEYQW